MTGTISKFCKKALRRLAQPQIFFYTLIWLMALLIMGTIAEKYIGLYSSQKIYFSSFVLWLGGAVPVPGGYSVMFIIFINLFSKLIVERWTQQKIGTLITHCAVILLLLGGFLTACFSSEGSMVIDQGGSVDYVEDYHRNELVIINTNGEEIIFKQNQLKPGNKLTASGLDFTLTPEANCAHCIITQRDSPLTDGTTHGMLVANDMRDAPLLPEESQNIPGIIFSISGAGTSDGRYGIFENAPITQHLATGSKNYTIELRRERTSLPFKLKLIKFSKDVYPGTDKPRAFQSEVIVQDGDLQWHSLISMNNPLRYKGYTFYQSSFIENDHGDLTVLAVVKNIGAIFPYIASITLCVGLMANMFIRLPKLKLKTPGDI